MPFRSLGMAIVSTVLLAGCWPSDHADMHVDRTTGDLYYTCLAGYHWERTPDPGSRECVINPPPAMPQD